MVSASNRSDSEPTMCLSLGPAAAPPSPRRPSITVTKASVEEYRDYKEECQAGHSILIGKAITRVAKDDPSVFTITERAATRAKTILRH